MNRPLVILGLSLLVQLLLVSGFSYGETIRVTGSNFAGVLLASENESSDVIDSYEVDYQMTGSLIGLIKLREGYSDVAFVMQTSEGSPSLDGLVSIPLGFWGIYFAVHEDNPLNEIAMVDMREILRKTSDGLKSEWGTLLPDEPQWTNRLIFVTFDVEEMDASFPVFLNQFFDNQVLENFSSMGERIENPYLAGGSNLLVLSELPQSNKGLRTLSLIQEGQEVGFPPSAEGMHFGDYPLCTTLYLVVRDSSDDKIKAFVRNFFEKNRLQNLQQNGLVRVPENVQKQALLEFDLEF